MCLYQQWDSQRSTYTQSEIRHDGRLHTLPNRAACRDTVRSLRGYLITNSTMPSSTPLGNVEVLLI